MHGRIIYSLHLFIYSVLYVYQWNHGYLFHTLGYNTILPYVLVLIVPALATGRSFSWLQYVILTYMCCFTCLRTSLFMTLQDASGSSCSDAFLVIESTASPMLWLKSGIRIQDLGEVYSCYWDVLAFSPSRQKEQRNVYVFMYILPHVSICAFVCLFLCLTICIYIKLTMNSNGGSNSNPLLCGLF